MRLTSIALGSAVLLAGCAGTATTDGAQIVQRSVPATFIAPTVQAGEQVANWWTLFADERFTSIAGNAGVDSIAIAETRLQQARAAFRQFGGRLGPSITASGSQSGSEVDDALTDSGQIGLSASWTLDLFGANLQRTRALLARADVAEIDVKVARISARAQAGRLLIQQDLAQRQFEASERAVAALANVARLTDARSRAGLGSRLDLQRARTSLEVARTDAPRFSAQRDAARRSLEALRGEAPGTLDVALTTPLSLAARDFAVLPPAQALMSRPDLLAAERALEAARLDAGAARADALPNISLSAFFGEQVFSPETLFNPSATLRRATAAVTLPIFQSGALIAGINLADARQREAALVWRQTGTQALAEIETALLQRNASIESLAAAVEAEALARDSARLLRVRWQAGLSTLTDVLLAERALYDAERFRAQADAAAAITIIDLSVALGLGGD